MDDRRRAARAQQQPRAQPAPEQEKKVGKSLWDLNLNDTCKEKKPDTETKSFLFVGDKQCGKTSLIFKMLDIQLAGGEQVKETIALDYRYANKTYEDWKVRVNTYELGGGRTLSSLLQAPLASTNLSSFASICIVLDLSKPGNCVESLLFWLSEVRKNCNASLEELKA